MKKSFVNFIFFGFLTASFLFLFQPEAYGLDQSAFPVFNVKDYGVVDDGKTTNTDGIQKAIDAAEKNGGGVVYFPPGDYLTGSIFLKDNVTLYLEAGSVIWASIKKEDYIGVGEDAKYYALIYTKDADNVAIRGRGIIDGQGYSFYEKKFIEWKKGQWSWAFTEAGKRKMWWPKKNMWRYASLISFRGCKNILLEDITIQYTPRFAVTPIDCDGITVRGISIIQGGYEEHRNNTDGIALDGCSNVRISDSYFDCGDDCISFKSNSPERKVCRDITVSNCVLKSTSTAIKIGTGSYGEFHNIVITNCTFKDASCGIGIWMLDGGLIDGLLINNISMDLTERQYFAAQPIFIFLYKRKLYYSENPVWSKGLSKPEDIPFGTIRNVTISNMTAEGDGGIFVSGAKEKYIENLTLDNVKILMRGKIDDKPWHEDPPYPFYIWGWVSAPYDIFIRYVDGLTLRNVEIIWNTPENPRWGSALRCWHVNNLEIDNFVGRQSAGSGAPAIWLKDVKEAFIHNCRAVHGTGTFLKLDKGTENITLIGNDLSRAQKSMIFQDVNSNEVFETSNRMP